MARIEMAEEVKHYQVNGKYRIVIERAASTKGVDGFKVEANGDDIDLVNLDARNLYAEAILMTKPPQVEVKESK